MSRTILFSPVGGTDPISQWNCYDGSLLHICRVYQPTNVVMYMSKEVLDNQEKDDRYRYCLDRLGEKIGWKAEYHIIERPELENVHEFDFFYEEFRKIMVEICDGLEEGDRVLLNVSSGTPAMKSGLLVLQTLGEFPCQAVQVSTPNKSMNEHHHKNYDVELLWELNEDNRDDFTNRCVLVKCPTLSKIKQEEVIKKHIAVYDYQAALRVSDMMRTEDICGYRELLELGAKRLMLDSSGVDQILANNTIDCLPVKSGDRRKCFEYALVLDIKVKKKEYADFVRAISPLIVSLFELILKEQAGIDISKYCEIKQHVRQWKMSTLVGTELLTVLDSAFKHPFTGGYVKAVHLKFLILHYAKQDDIKTLSEELRLVEEKARNLAAHEIVSIDDEKIQKLTGFTSNQIMGKLKRAFTYTKTNIRAEAWQSYDDMNCLILEAMG